MSVGLSLCDGNPMSELSREYLEAALERVRDYVPDWLWQEIHRGAFPSAGGRARHRPAPVPNELEKLALQEMRPRTLARVDDQELLQAWHRLNQWYGAAKRNGKAIENLVNAAHWVMAEAKKRGVTIDMEGELAQEAAQLAKSLPGRLGQLWGLMPHEDVMVVPDFVSLVGGAVRSADSNDVDVLIRAERIEDTFPINAYSVELPIRNLLDPDKDGYLHYIANSQGPHADYVPLFDLVLRARPNAEMKMIKGAKTTAALSTEQCNAPTFAYVALHGKRPDTPISGRTDGPTHSCDGIQIDVQLKCSWIQDLNAIPEIEGRASCEGHAIDGIRIPSYFIFRLKPDLEAVAQEIATSLNQGLGGALAGMGTARRPRIVVATSKIAGEPGWQGFWMGLPDRIKRAIQQSKDHRTTKARHRRDKCMLCDRPPTVEVLWAEGKAHAWFCAQCFKEWKAESEWHDVTYTKPIEHGIARKEFSDRVSPTSLDKAEARPKPGEKIVKGAGATGGLMFVGSRPTILEAVRGIPLVGPDGATFRDVYLSPLRLSRDQVYVSNLVPLPLGRMPTDEEIALWRGRLQTEISAVRPVAIVALGKQAAAALGDDACLFLPHPNAVRRMGNSGEVRRKLARLQGILAQKAALGEEGGEQPATQEWVRTWHKRFPASGQGRFVYQHHWRGLDEEESKLSERALLATDHSVHGDLRMTAADGELWGVSVFLGKTADNRAGDRLLGLRQSQDNLQFAHKPPQPTSWLKVGVRKPYISPPGGVGSTSRTWAVFNALDSGSYRVGVWRDHMVELFFEGKHLKGRYLLQYAPVGARGRLWIVDAPENQTPYAETHKLEKVLAELKQKRQRWLLWSDGKSIPQLYDVKGGKPVSKMEVYIDFAKADDERQIVYGVVSEPEVEDTQGDSATAEEIELAAHQYLTMSRVVGMEHRKVARAQVVESYVAPRDFELGDEKVRKGSWVLAVHVEDSGDWARVKSGELSGFSLGGYGVRSNA